MNDTSPCKADPGASHCAVGLTPAPSYLDLEQRIAAAEARVAELERTNGTLAVRIGEIEDAKLAAEARAEKAEREAECRLCHCCMDAPDRHGEILGDWVVRAEAAEAERDALLAEIQKWREGRAYLGVPMTYVDQRLVDETRRYIGDRRAAGVKYG